MWKMTTNHLGIFPFSLNPLGCQRTKRPFRRHVLDWWAYEGIGDWFGRVDRFGMCRLLCEQAWEVVGVDNDMRSRFFGAAGTTRPVVEDLCRLFPAYRHVNLDICARQAIRDLLETERPDFIIHTAAQPSHDKAASIPYEDFDTNAVGTMNLLVAARDFCREAPFCFHQHEQSVWR